MRLIRYPLSQLPQQPRLADASLSAQQRHLPETVLHLLPALEQQSHLLLSAHECGETGARRLETSRDSFFFVEDAVYLERHRDALGCVEAEITAGKPALNQTVCGGADHHGVGLGDCLKPRREVRCLTEGQLLMPGPAPDLAHYDEPRVNAHANRESGFALTPEAGV